MWEAQPSQRRPQVVCSAPLPQQRLRARASWTTRYPSIAAAVEALACRSYLIDGEVVICGDDGVPAFDRPPTGGGPRLRRCSGSLRATAGLPLAFANPPSLSC
jgi:hypothetical protein